MCPVNRPKVWYAGCLLLDTDQKRDIADKKNEANAQANAQLISVYNIAMRYSVLFARLGVLRLVLKRLLAAVVV